MCAQAAYEEDLDEVFDVAAVRAALESRLRSLESELHQVGLIRLSRPPFHASAAHWVSLTFSCILKPQAPPQLLHAALHDPAAGTQAARFSLDCHQSCSPADGSAAGADVRKSFLSPFSALSLGRCAAPPVLQVQELQQSFAAIHATLVHPLAADRPLPEQQQQRLLQPLTKPNMPPDTPSLPGNASALSASADKTSFQVPLSMFS
jgi:hypothetical protein